MAKARTVKAAEGREATPAAPVAEATPAPVVEAPAAAPVIESAPVYRIATGVTLTSLRGIVESGAIVTPELWVPGTFDELVRTGKIVRA